MSEDYNNVWDVAQVTVRLVELGKIVAYQSPDDDNIHFVAANKASRIPKEARILKAWRLSNILAARQAVN